MLGEGQDPQLLGGQSPWPPLQLRIAAMTSEPRYLEESSFFYLPGACFGVEGREDHS